MDETATAQPRRFHLPRWLRGQQGLRVCMATLLLAGIAWRVGRWAMGFPLWGDEAFVAVNLLVRDYSGMLGALEHWQVVPPGFLWLALSAVKLLGTHEWALRLVPMLAGVGALVVLWRFSRAALPGRAAVLAVGLLGATYYAVRHGAEVKAYTTDLLVSVSVLALAWTLLKRSASAARWTALLLVCAAGVWLSFPAVFVCAGAAMALGLVGIKRRDACLIGGAVLVAAVAGGWFWVVYRVSVVPQAASAAALFEMSMWELGFPPVDKPWLLPWWALKVHAGRMLAYPIGSKNFGSALTLILVLVGTARLWRTRRRALLAVLLGPILPAMVAAGLHKYPYGGSMRHMLYLAPTFCMLAGVGAAQLLRVLPRGVHARRGLVIVTALLAGIALAGLAVDGVRPYKRIDDLQNRRTIAALARRAQPGERWIVYNSLSEVPWSRDLMIDGGTGARFRYYVTAWAPGKLEWAPAPGTVAPANGSTVLLVLDRHDDPDRPAFDRAKMLAYVAMLEGQLGPYTQAEPRLDRGDKGFDRILVFRFDGQKSP